MNNNLQISYKSQSLLEPIELSLRNNKWLSRITSNTHLVCTKRQVITWAK